MASDASPGTARDATPEADTGDIAPPTPSQGTGHAAPPSDARNAASDDAPVDAASSQAVVASPQTAAASPGTLPAHAPAPPTTLPLRSDPAAEAEPGQAARRRDVTWQVVARTVLWPLACTALALLIAFGGGVASARRSIESTSPLGSATAGPWRSIPFAGLAEADPYTRARLSLTGALPLGIAEGLSFTARTDDEGRALDGTCRYRLDGPFPPARWWTLYANPRPDAANLPTALHSRAILREREGGFAITVASDLASGNWLAIEGSGPFTLTATLYDTSVTREGGLAASAMPSIVRLGCANAQGAAS